MCLEATYWEKFSVSYNTLVSLTNTANCILITNWPFSCNLLYKGVGKPPQFPSNQEAGRDRKERL